MSHDVVPGRRDDFPAMAKVRLAVFPPKSKERNIPDLERIERAVYDCLLFFIAISVLLISKV